MGQKHLLHLSWSYSILGAKRGLRCSHTYIASRASVTLHSEDKNPHLCGVWVLALFHLIPSSYSPNQRLCWGFVFNPIQILVNSHTATRRYKRNAIDIWQENLQQRFAIKETQGEVVIAADVVPVSSTGSFPAFFVRRTVGRGG